MPADYVSELAQQALKKIAADTGEEPRPGTQPGRLLRFGDRCTRPELAAWRRKSLPSLAGDFFLRDLSTVERSKFDAGGGGQAGLPYPAFARKT